MHTTHNINTSTTGPREDSRTTVITDTKHLSDIIFTMASDQLVLDAASANLQASIEAAKKAYDEATRETSERIATNLAAVEVFAAKNRDALFPMKGQARVKTFKVLQHALKYRSSESVSAPEGEAEKIVDNAMAAARAAKADAFLIEALELLLRPQPSAWDKDQVKRSLKGPHAATITELTGLTLHETETFKVEFNFTPTAA